MNKVIKKAKITKGRTVEVVYVEHLDDKTEREHSVSCDQLYHNDLEAAFEKLRAHLVLICDQKEGVGITDLENIPEDQLSKIKVTSFTISGNDESEGVVIVGQKHIGDKVLNLISPFTMYEDDYKFAGELTIDIQACIYEVEQYLFEGKYAIKQLEMIFEEKDPDSQEFDQESANVANAVLSAVVNGKVKKGGKKNKVMIEPEPFTGNDQVTQPIFEEAG